MNSLSQLDNTSFSQSASFRDSTHVPHYSEPLNFYDIDDILASELKVPCSFNVTAYRLGYLHSNSKSEHIQTGTNIELPLWLAKSLAGKKNIVKVCYVTLDIYGSWGGIHSITLINLYWLLVHVNVTDYAWHCWTGSV